MNNVIIIIMCGLCIPFSNPITFYRVVILFVKLQVAALALLALLLVLEARCAHLSLGTSII